MTMTQNETEYLLAAPASNATIPLKGEKRWAYLTRQKTIRVASLNEDGTIYLSPLWYVVADQTIYIPVDAASRLGQNAEAARALSALVDTGDEYATVSGVRITGKLVPVDDNDLVERLQGLVFEKYFHVGHPYAESYFEFGNAAGRRFYQLVAEKTVGWDSRELAFPPAPEARVLPDVVGDRLLP